MEKQDATDRIMKRYKVTIEGIERTSLEFLDMELSSYRARLQTAKRLLKGGSQMKPKDVASDEHVQYLNEKRKLQQRIEDVRKAAREKLDGVDFVHMPAHEMKAKMDEITAERDEKIHIFQAELDKMDQTRMQPRPSIPGASAEIA